MNRRDFLRTAGGVSGGAAAAGAAAPAAASADEETTDTSGPGTTDTPPNGTATPGGTTAPAGTVTPGGRTVANGTTAANGTTPTGDTAPAGPTKEVAVGPGGNLVFEPSDLTIAPGTTVKFVWESDNHNIVVDSQPDGANWEGTPGGASDLYNTGYEYSHTFQTTGTYEYYCDPHLSAGMEASITVQQGGGGGAAELDPHEMGVPFQAHFVGAATVLAIVVSLVFTFYVLKYGESPNASSPNRD